MRKITSILFLVILLLMPSAGHAQDDIMSMTFHYSDALKVGDHFQWEITQLDFNSTYDITVHEGLETGALVDLEIIDNPTNFSFSIYEQIYPTAKFFEMNIGNKAVNLTASPTPAIVIEIEMNYSEYNGSRTTYFLSLINPTEITFDNGTQISFIDFIESNEDNSVTVDDQSVTAYDSEGNFKMVYDLKTGVIQDVLMKEDWGTVAYSLISNIPTEEDRLSVSWFVFFAVLPTMLVYRHKKYNKLN